MQVVAVSIPNPALEPVRCNSWIVVDRVTGLPVLETYSRTTASAINQTRYEVLTAYAWLVRFNRSLRGFTRADIAKRLSHWFAIMRPTLDTSEPADTAAQRQRAEAAERKARMAALQAQLAKERAARVAEPVEEPTRFSLLEVDEAADPARSIEAWKMQRARNTVRPVTATTPEPTPAPRRKPFEVVDAQADGLSGGAAFAVLLGRAMNQNC